MKKYTVSYNKTYFAENLDEAIEKAEFDLHEALQLVNTIDYTTPFEIREEEATKEEIEEYC